MRYEAFPALGEALSFEDAVAALRQRFPQAHGAFRLPRGGSIKEVVRAQAIPRGYGVYVIRTAPSRSRAAFLVGKSGTVNQTGLYGAQTLPDRPTKKQSHDEWREKFFRRRMDELDLEGLDVTWVITLAGRAGALPGLVEAWLLQAHLITYGRLPLHNKSA